MLHVTVIAVGKLKERYWADACLEYTKRLSAFCRPAAVEVEEHRLPQSPSPAQITQCVHAEGDAILTKIPPRSICFALCIEGSSLSSEQFAAKLDSIKSEHSHAVFVIGGSHGLSDPVKRRANYRLSISPMTFPHQLARVLLLEQLYRSFSITSGGKYHK